MVDVHGRVKVLDFGLAKLSAPSTPPAAEEPTRTFAMDQPHTEEGAIVGSVPYMSPEQAEGRPLDARSDIFSFGVVMYEMLSGRKPFQGATRVATLSAILKESPKPLSELAPGIPRDLERLVDRCLRKDPERRWQSMRDLRVALLELQEESDSGALAAAERPEGVRRKGPRLAIAVAAAVALIGAAAWWWAHRTVQEPEQEVMVVPLTAHTGDERDPSFSPDGSQVAFSWVPDDGLPDIYIKLIGPGEPIRLTHTPNADERLPKWSPDGKWIVFLRSVRSSLGVLEDKWAAVVIPALGGPERALAEDVSNSSLSWSPDSHWVVYAGGNPRSLYLGSVHGAERKLVVGPLEGKYPVSAGFISPDGRKLAVNFSIGRYEPLYVVDLSAGQQTEGQPKLLTPADWIALSPVWTADSKEVLFIRGSGGNAGLDTAMFRVSTVGGPPKQVQFAGNNPWFFDVARQGHRMAFTRMHRKANIYGVEFETGGVISKEAQVIASSSRQDRYPTFSPDGTRIAFVSNRSGPMEIWTAQADGQDPVQLTTSQDPDVTSQPQWSPDGGKIAYISKGISKPSTNVFVMPSAGGVAQKVTDDDFSHYLPSWSRDGRWIYFAKGDYGDWNAQNVWESLNIWKVPVSGGAAIQVTRHGGVFAQESLDGKWLYFATPEYTIRRAPLAGGEEREFAREVPWFSFSVTTHGIYYLGSPTGRQGAAIRFISHAGGEPKVIGSIQRPVAGGLSLSPDGQSLLYSQFDQLEAELMLVENFH
jgi:Tol biopolymer transport system component/plasmid stabilization system protein ParE